MSESASSVKEVGAVQPRTPARWKIYWKPAEHAGRQEIEQAFVVVSIKEGPSGGPAEYTFPVNVDRISSLRSRFWDLLLFTTRPRDRDWNRQGAFRGEGFYPFCLRQGCRQNGWDFCDGEVEAREHAQLKVPEHPDLERTPMHLYAVEEDVLWTRSV